jgi:hypothetical protein
MEDELDRTCSTRGMNMHTKFLDGKPEVLVRPRRRWNDNIKTILRETGWDDEDRIHLAQNRDQCQACEHGNEPSCFIKGG